MNEQISTTHSSVIRNDSNILQSWYKFQMTPYADFSICWFQLCTHIQIVPICCLNEWVAKSHTWGDERRTGSAYSLNVEAFLEEKKNPGSICLFMLRDFGFVMAPGHAPVFTEYVQVQHVCRLVICSEFVLAQLDLHLPPSKVGFQRCIFRLLNSWWVAFQEFMVSVSYRPLLQPTPAIIDNSHFPHTQEYTCSYIPMGIDFYNIFVISILYFAIFLVTVYILYNILPILCLVIPDDWWGTKYTIDIDLQCLSARNISTSYLKAVRDPGEHVS